MGWGRGGVGGGSCIIDLLRIFSPSLHYVLISKGTLCADGEDVVDMLSTLNRKHNPTAVGSPFSRLYQCYYFVPTIATRFEPIVEAISHFFKFCIDIAGVYYFSKRASWVDIRISHPGEIHW